MKKKIYTLIILAVVFISYNIQAVSAPVNAPVRPVKSTVVTKSSISQAIAQNISPISLVNNPSAYLNKTVAFSGEFVSFTSLGLDYKPAFRDGGKYIGILMKRPDVKNHTIPLSELKMFMSRELAEKNIDIETGDMFSLKGKVFSTALGDPWLDITEFKITNKKTKTEEKK